MKNKTYYKVVNKKDGLLVMKIYMLNDGIRELLKNHDDMWHIYIMTEEEELTKEG